jgi:hypothetical protein
MVMAGGSSLGGSTLGSKCMVCSLAPAAPPHGLVHGSGACAGLGSLLGALRMDSRCFMVYAQLLVEG